MNKRDINEFIDYINELWGSDNVVKVVRDDKPFSHIYRITTPASNMTVFVMGDWGFNGSHTTVLGTKTATSGDRDAKTLAFFFNQEKATVNKFCQHLQMLTS